MKSELTAPTTLALYDPDAPTTISADASSYGLGAVLLQKTALEWKPVAYASRSMSETECRYAQIEKEALALTWACEKFSDYVLGKVIALETDHKPLVPLLGTKQLNSLPPRVLRFRLRLDRFDYTIRHVPGKQLYIADTLSRAPLASVDHNTALEELAELIMETHVAHLPASKERLETYRTAQSSDPTTSLLIRYSREGWPDKDSAEPVLKPYWEVRGELTIGENLLLCGGRIVVPESLREVTSQKLHQGHQGIQRCRLRAQSSVWWPGLSKQISDLIKRCPECSRNTTPNKEPLMPTPLPDYPWQKVSTDLFFLKGATYILVVDYFSRYPEVIQLKTTTAHGVITALKSIFSRHGVPEEVVSDNGPQYSSQAFTEFASRYGFVHSTSSPHFPQSNGHSERAVKTMKKILKASEDQYLALLAYRSTPLPWCGLSPSELLMGRRTRSDIPQTKEKLSPQWSYLEKFRHLNEEFKARQKADFDRRHRVRPLPDIPDDTDVWVTTDREARPGRVITHANAPRSYVVDTSHGPVRRNRSQLNIMPGPPSTTDSSTPSTPPIRDPIMTRSRTGTRIAPPTRL